MKKTVSLLLCLALCLTLAAPAVADVLWEPTDEFYWANYDACRRDDAEYEALTDVPIQKSPEKAAAQGTVPAGELAFVYYRWEDWGYVEDDRGAGWIDLHQFRRLYNSADFTADHAEEIVSEAGTVSREENEVIFLWTFPGSGTLAGSIDREGFAWSENDPAYGAVWTDESGRRWGRVNYYYGLKGWICLDEPGADDLPAEALRYAKDDIGAVPAGGAETGSRAALWTAGLIAAVVAATAAIVLVFVLKKRPEAE